jgi:drug/metabolite transporter (DMT)-like permease
MAISAGIIFILIAIIGWGFGDFFIQKVTRKYGDWEPLFIVTLFGAIVLFPFIYKGIPSLFSFNAGFWILLSGSAILFIAALLNFEALKRGKLDIVEPIWSLEIPMSALLAFVIMKEVISAYQIILIAMLIIGLVFVSVRSTKISGRILLEKGAFMAVVAAILMGAANFFVGWGARISDALMVNWFFNVFIAAGCLIFLAEKHRVKRMFSDMRKSKSLWLGMCIFDNAAWIAYAFAVTLIPIAITIALSDSYIVLAVLLGMFVNKEKLHHHQKIGLVLAIIAALILAFSLG